MTTDPVIEAVRADLLARSQKGIVKYGTTLGDNEASELERLQHLYEELLDGAAYCKWRMLQIERLGKRALRDYGLDPEEAISMAYDNVRQEAKDAIKGVRMSSPSSPISAPARRSGVSNVPPAPSCSRRASRGSARRR